eukprot:TRINITY_DN7897_c0_g2_i1.p1 TRINITY_DN7897_c0_g2~~TRINITY_DN7897_c0_g2_i1.p1  ORF type:complete len:155 (+),score=10.11 TRINITY_DN7897_c0_g2_i1:1-465(+)
MRGWQKLFYLDEPTVQEAVQWLIPMAGPAGVFRAPLPDPADPSSLRPGVLTTILSRDNFLSADIASNAPPERRTSLGLKPPLSFPPTLKESIEAARAATMQYIKPQNWQQPSRTFPNNPRPAGGCEHSGAYRGGTREENSSGFDARAPYGGTSH